MAAGVTVTLDGNDMGKRVSHVSINRGRQDELDRTGAGTCTVSLNYVDGSIADLVRGLWRSESGNRWLVPLAVFLCLFGLILILATTVEALAPFIYAVF